MQERAFQGAQTMTPAWQTGAGSEVASRAAFGGLRQSYDPYQTGQFTGATAQQYMSPYMQNVVDVQQREAARQSDILRTQNQAQATAQGAYGGSRQGLLEAERQRNLASQLGDIQAKGLQAAYDQAGQRFQQEQQLREQSRQYGAGLGLQGLQTALQGAGALGQLGAQAFGQGMDINKLQAAYGQQQQQLEQAKLGQQYQDFLNQQNYPYKQLGFMSDLLRGTAGLTQQAQSIYQPPPSMLQTMGSLGMSAYGLGKMFAVGGAVEGKSEGYYGDDASDESSYGLGGIALNQLNTNRGL
jgi:hypothetical protein